MAASVFCQLMVGQDLCSSSAKYTILQFIGEGAYGKVAKCKVDLTGELVAVKIIKYIDDEGKRCERSMLRILSRVNSDMTNMLKFYKSFEYLGCTCLVFELLGQNLYDRRGLMHVYQIRPIAKQMLVALQALKHLQIIHADIKPDNIVLVNNEESPRRFKLIDFGVAIPSFHATFGMTRQVIGYRAPEMSLGLPFTEAIDMWALGCTLAFLYLRFNLFPVHCEYLMMKSMVEMLGMPSDHKLQFGAYTERFFIEEEEDEYCSGWRLLTPKEYSAIHTKKAQKWPKGRLHYKSLDDLPHWWLSLSEEEDAEEMQDSREFIDFLKQLLNMDEEKRISPEAALQHPFITMSHLSQDAGSSDYLTKAQAFMSGSEPTGNDVAAHEDNGKAHTFQQCPAAGQGESIETDVSEDGIDSAPLSPSSGEIEIETNVHKELHRSSPSCDETVDSVAPVNGPVVEDVPTPTTKRFSGILRRLRNSFRIRKTF